jgi:spermidine synthase
LAGSELITLATHDSEFGEVTILRSDEGTTIYKVGGIYQSEADEEGTSTVSYIHALCGLVRDTSARRVLMIGCGGGTLATMLVRYGIRVAIVDPDPVAFKFARTYFNLPAGAECHIGDGFEYLKRANGRYDSIVVDAFQADRAPSHFLAPAFFAAAWSALRSGGCFFANVHVMNDEDYAADLYAARAHEVWHEVKVLDAWGEVNRNSIVAAGEVANLLPPKIVHAPSSGAEAIARELEVMRFREPRTLNG